MKENQLGFKQGQLWKHAKLHAIIMIDANQFQCQSGICKHRKNPDCEGQCIKRSWMNDGDIGLHSNDFWVHEVHEGPTRHVLERLNLLF